MEEKTLECDLFRNLPDEILCHIVSFLPNESSLETCLISTRWWNLWNEALVRHGTKDDVTDAVSNFVTSFEEFDPLRHPRKLQFHFGEEIEALVATIANNSKLLVDFSPCNEKELQIHYELHLNLLNKQRINFEPFPPSTFIVRTLYLKSVTCLTSEVASSIVSSLEHIENLVIMECKGLKDLSIDSKAKLQKLTIFNCLQLKSLHLRTCKLKSFQYRGPLPWIRLEYHFNLSDAMLDFRIGPSCSNFRSKDFDATLLTIKNSEVLTLCKWNFEALIWPSISHICGSFKFYKLRELWWIESYEGEYNMDALFCFLKLCPDLEQLIVTIDPESYSAAPSNLCLIMPAPKCTKLEHLKLVTFVGFASRADEISMAKNLVKLIDKGKPPKIKASDGSCLDAVFIQ